MSRTLPGSPASTSLKTVGTLRSGSAADQAFQKGMILRFKKEVPQAIEVLDKAHRLFTESGDTLGQIYCLIESGWLHDIIKERARSEKLLRDAETLIEQHPDIAGMNEARARCLHYKGLILYQNESYGPAIKLFKQALTVSEPRGLETAKIYDSLGVHYERTGDFHRAVRYLRSALQIKVALKEPAFEEGVTCQILGRLHLLYEDYDLAYDHLQRSLDICSSLKDEKRKASLKNELIRLFLRCGKEAEARTLINEMHRDCQNRHLKVHHSMSCFYEAYIHYSHREYTEARGVLEKDVIPVFQKFHFKKGLAMAKRLMAWVDFSLNPDNTVNALANMGEAIELFRFEKMIDEVAKTHFELGKLYYTAGNDKLALASFLDSLKMAEENGLFYLTPYIEDEIFRTHEPRWEEIVNKRTKHERIFERRQPLLESLTQLMDNEHAHCTHPHYDHDEDDDADRDPAPPGVLPENGNGHAPAENAARAPKLKKAKPLPAAHGPHGGTGQEIPFLMSLLRVGQAMAAERDLDKLLQLIKEETERALEADRCTVFLYDSDTNELWSRVASGLDHTEEIRFPAHQGLAGYVVKTGEILNVQNAYQDPRFNPEVDRQTGYKTHTMLCIPMKNRKGDIIGVFQVLNKKNDIFLSSDEDLLQAIASSAGIALENAQLYREQKITFESFIKALSSTIDARDPITAGHSERVMEYSLMIGENMHMSEQELESLKYSALLHDIGKIGVKEEVLVKEGRLTVKEYRHIQEHVYFTYEILKNIHFEKHLRDIPEVASSHHEKMDGSGYFRGIKGEHIHIGGRVLAVADVFDAITSRRQYRKRMPFNRAMRILREDAGSHFDADIVDTFLECSLHDLSRVLCMDNRLPATPQEVQAALKRIPPDVTIKEYIVISKKENPTKREAAIHEAFHTLYHFSEIAAEND